MWGDSDERTLAQAGRCAEHPSAWGAHRGRHRRSGYGLTLGGRLRHRLRDQGGAHRRAGRGHRGQAVRRPGRHRAQGGLWAWPVQPAARTAPCAGGHGVDRRAGDRRAPNEGSAQPGTAGSGHPFVDPLADEDGGPWVAAHFGSPALGHGICSGFLILAVGRPFEVNRSPLRSLLFPRVLSWALVSDSEVPASQEPVSPGGSPGQSLRARTWTRTCLARRAAQWAKRTCARCAWRASPPMPARSTWWARCSPSSGRGPPRRPRIATTAPGPRSTASRGSSLCARARRRPGPGRQVSSAGAWGTARRSSPGWTVRGPAALIARSGNPLASAVGGIP